MMIISRNYDPCSADLRGTVVALGNFDGVHLGHRAILNACVQEARRLHTKPAVMTFFPHPREFFGRRSQPLRLQSFRQKMTLFEEAGIEVVFAVRFNAAFAALSAQDFVEKMLRQSMAVRHVVTGYNFAFGKGRGGDTAFLDAAARAAGMGFTRCEAVQVQGAVVSSSAIRDLLAQGRVREAAVLLGRGYRIEGRVQHGDKRGGAIGTPTANIALGALFRPAYGVYAVRIAVDGVWHQGVANVGIRPTFAVAEPLMEVHVFDMRQDLYGARVEVELVDYLREERCFDGVEALKMQIADDVSKARHILGDII